MNEFVNKIIHQIDILANQTKQMIKHKAYLELGFSKEDSIEYERIPVFSPIFELKVVEFFKKKVHDNNELLVSAEIVVENHFQKRSSIRIVEKVPLEVIEEIIKRNLPYFYELIFKDHEERIKKQIQEKEAAIKQIEVLYSNLESLKKELQFLIEEYHKFLNQKKEFFKKPFSTPK